MVASPIPTIEDIRKGVAEAVRLSQVPIVEVRLYGSVARGTATEQSDIDLLVVIPESVPKRYRVVMGLRELFQSVFQKRVHLLIGRPGQVHRIHPTGEIFATFDTNAIKIYG
jgi:predicted nucleotidyltransferase